MSQFAWCLGVVSLPPPPLHPAPPGRSAGSYVPAPVAWSAAGSPFTRTSSVSVVSAPAVGQLNTTCRHAPPADAGAVTVTDFVLPLAHTARVSTVAWLASPVIES